MSDGFCCPRCGYVTASATCMRRHLKRQKPCSAIMCEDVTVDEAYRAIFGGIDGRARPHVCDGCGKRFTSKHALKYHVGVACNAQSIATPVYSTPIADRAEARRGGVGAAVNVSGVGNVVNIQNNQTNVTINAFGRERLDHLTQQFLDKCVRRRDKGLVELLEKIHFDTDHADNNNVKITNKKLPFIMYHTGEKWVTDKKGRVLDRLVDKGHGIMQDHLDDHEDRLMESMSQTMFDCIRKWMDEVADRDKQTMEELLTDIYLLIINSSSSQ
jgi:hypothetical protein